VIAVEVNQRVEKMRLDLVSLDRTIKVFDARLDLLKIEPIHALSPSVASWPWASPIRLLSP
jgi:hypothetical protein